MPRNLDAGMVTATSKQFTNPIYLIEQDMGASVVRSSTRELIDFGGDDYVPLNGAAVEAISGDKLTWSLDNSDRAISIMALGNDVGGNDVTLYLHYEGNTITRFTGVIDSWITRGQRVVFVATSAAAKKAKIPK